MLAKRPGLHCLGFVLWRKDCLRKTNPTTYGDNGEIWDEDELVKYTSRRSQARDWGMMDAMWGRTGCRTGYLNELENGAMLKDGKFAGEGDGRGSQLGDCAGGENPKNDVDRLSAEPTRRNWLIEVGFASCGFINEYAPPL